MRAERFAAAVRNLVAFVLVAMKSAMSINNKLCSNRMKNFAFEFRCIRLSFDAIRYSIAPCAA